VSEASLVNKLRETLEERIKLEIEGLVIDPQPRQAGRIEAFREAARMIDDEYAKTNDIREQT
jgi:hypothetical protein